MSSDVNGCASGLYVSATRVPWLVERRRSALAHEMRNSRHSTWIFHPAKQLVSPPRKISASFASKTIGLRKAQAMGSLAINASDE